MWWGKWWIVRARKKNDKPRQQQALMTNVFPLKRNLYERPTHHTWWKEIALKSPPCVCMSVYIYLHEYWGYFWQKSQTNEQLVGDKGIPGFDYSLWQKFNWNSSFHEGFCFWQTGVVSKKRSAMSKPFIPKFQTKGLASTHLMLAV